MTKLADLIAKNMDDPEFRAAWDEADAESRPIAAMIRARTAAGLTQAEPGGRLGTTQSAIARLEGGRVSP